MKLCVHLSIHIHTQKNSRSIIGSMQNLHTSLQVNEIFLEKGETHNLHSIVFLSPLFSYQVEEHSSCLLVSRCYENITQPFWCMTSGHWRSSQSDHWCFFVTVGYKIGHYRMTCGEFSLGQKEKQELGQNPTKFYCKPQVTHLNQCDLKCIILSKLPVSSSQNYFSTYNGRQMCLESLQSCQHIPKT